MYLPQVFDTVNHDLFLAKLKAYGSSKDTLTLMSSYLTNCKQKAIINNSAGTAKTVVARVPQKINKKRTNEQLIEFSIFKLV